MASDFADPSSYLTYLQIQYAKHHDTEKDGDAEFLRITREQAKAYGHEIPDDVGIGYAIDGIFNNILYSLSPELQTTIRAKIRAGILENGEANAFIAKSPEGWFAILNSSVLCSFLHKYVKLIVALNDPSCVIYCNRTQAEYLTIKDISEYIGQTVGYFRENAVPRGPRIKLSTAATINAGAILVSAESFVLCHELGHFINGDLEEKSSYAALPFGASGMRYVENKNHMIEYKADSVGFRLYLAARQNIGIGVGPLKAALAPVLMMFDLFYQLGRQGSESHPHPYDRVVRITKDHFGPKTAKKIAAALADPRLIATVFPHRP